MRIYIIGFMGAGKSFVGKGLSRRLNLPFFDLDEQIEQKEAQKIPEIFEVAGEEEFRKKEREMLHASLIFKNGIIATGGGTPCHFDNLQWMKDKGMVIYLKVGGALLYKRLLKNQADRPLIRDLSESQLKAFIHKKLEQRSDFYEAAHLIYEVENNEAEIIDELKAYLEAFFE